MATRSIVTSFPDVACDVCGRRLLRGEHPDVFLAGGQRRTVCELCVPRASAEGWMREADSHSISARPTRGRRGGSLLGRLRQLREPVERPMRRESLSDSTAADPDGSREGLYEFLDDGSLESASAYDHELYIGSVEAVEGTAEVWDAQADTHAGEPGEDFRQPWEDSGASSHAEEAVRSAEDLNLARALEVFNAGEPPRRVAGVARSLGAPSITVRSLEDSSGKIAIVVAWELCWYRYEVDLADEAAGACMVAQGMELDELPAADRLANATADERGELSPLFQIG
jgi:hypothetical protein